ncbi:hypothetical protein A2V94_07085 [Candidatus Atribacteria bacterium RBG_16_35_8]|nr:MAG: hypothetical protein A2V94_07085 [Candidatus Atribacteria bacterium RBG_16_35_8]
MSIAETRGGAPEIFRADIDTGGLYHFLKATSKWICIRVKTNTCRVFFTKEDFDNDINYIEIVADDCWKGPIETNKIWFKGVGGASSIELVVARRLN